MGNTVWVMAEGQQEDEWDHSLVLSQEKHLAALAEALKVNKLSEFFDYSELAENPDDKPQYLNADDAIATLTALIAGINDHHPAYKGKHKHDMVDELEDCLKKITKASKKDRKVRMAVIA
jgi:hypothetical protein